MKWGFNKRLFQRSLHTFVMICACIVFYLVLMNMRVVTGLLGKTVDILSPFIIGAVLAYLLNAPMRFFETTVFAHISRNPNSKLRRTLALVCTFLAALIVIVTLFSIVIPQLVDSVDVFVDNMNRYISQFSGYLMDLAERLQIDRVTVENFLNQWKNFTGGIVSFVEEHLPKILNYVPNLLDFSKQVTGGISDALIGITVSVYLLADKERFCAQSKKLLFAIFKSRHTARTLEVLRFTHLTFSDYIVGKLINALIIGVVCFIGLLVLDIPFALLISVIVAITDIIPIFGPFIGGFVGGIILLMVDPIKVIWFVVFVIVLQQVDGNIIGPKILGESTGLSGFWVIFAIVVGGGVFGFVGMLIGVPTFSVIYTLIRGWVSKRLQIKGLPHETEEYMHTAQDPTPKS